MHPAFNILIVVAIYGILMVLLAVIRMKGSHFICPKCGFDFQVIGIKYLLSPKTFTRHYVTCPRCGYKGFMKILPGKI